MKFSFLADVLNKIAQISSRTAITELLAHLFDKATAQEARIIAYITLGSLRPPYEGTQFSLAERSVKKVLEDLLEVSPVTMKQLVKEYGDLGEVVARAAWQDYQEFELTEVYDALLALESISGVGSQEHRMETFKQFLRVLGPLQAGLVIRIVLGKLRLGFSDMTLIDALSWMLAGNKSLHVKIEHAYNICADIGHIAYVLKQDGIEGLNKIVITVGIPIRPAAAERLPTAQDIIDKLGPCVAQPKIDGFRLQIHMSRTGQKAHLWFFSRNLINMSDMFPDLHKDLEHIPVHSCILEGEAIGFDETTGTFTPFQETVKRKRKHDIEEIAKEFPLKLFLFDLLYLNGESLLGREHHVRREVLVQLMKQHTTDAIHVIEERPIHTARALESYFKEMVSEGLEGLVVKKPKSHYQPGKRNFNWIKLKRHEQTGGLEDTLDTVVLGYYYGRGKRAHFGVGAFLVGIYDKKTDCFETIAKVGTGLSDQAWVDFKKRCDAISISGKPHNVVCAKELEPDVWVHPSLVVEVRADEITQSPVHTACKNAENALGLALRFPRMVGYRPDKAATQATAAAEVRRLFVDQRAA